MATNYPSSLDNATSLPYPNATDDTNSPSLAGGQDNQNDALIAIETLVGTNASQTDPTAQYNVLQATSASASEWAKLTSNNVSSSTGTGSFVFATSPTISSPTISSPTISSPNITGSLGNISTGTITASGAITASSTLAVTGDTTLTGSLTGSTISTSGQITMQSSTSPPSAGASTAGLLMSSTSSFGIFYGSEAPTFTAAQGSIYLRTDGSSTSTRLYVNTTGSTTWTNFTSAT